MSESLALRGRLAVNEKAIHALTCGIDTDIEELRTLADKFEEKIELKTDRMVLVTDRLNTQVIKLREITNQSAAIKKELGE